MYYELEDNEKNRKLFSKLHEMTGVKGVPTTGVFYGGDELCAVVEGTFNVARAPEMIAEAMEEGGGVLLVLGSGKYLVGWADSRKLRELFLGGEGGE